jgi:hypothetical protein
MTSWFYWREAQRDVKGDDLATCLHLYGTGGERDDDRDMETKVVFLEETTLHGILVAAHSHTRGHHRAGSPVRSQGRRELVMQHCGINCTGVSRLAPLQRSTLHGRVSRRCALSGSRVCVHDGVRAIRLHGRDVRLDGVVLQDLCAPRHPPHPPSCVSLTATSLHLNDCNTSWKPLPEERCFQGADSRRHETRAVCRFSRDGAKAALTNGCPTNPR